MVVWEACNILGQRETLPWQVDVDGKLLYHRSVHRGRGAMEFRLAVNPEVSTLEPMGEKEGTVCDRQFLICGRPVCISYLRPTLPPVACPWEEALCPE